MGYVGTDNGLVNIKNGIIKTIVPIEKNGLRFENIQSLVNLQTVFISLELKWS